MNTQNDSLLWLAVRYHCDELDVTDTASFENQLTEDQGAREALSKAVEICEAYRLAEAEIEMESLQPNLATLVTASSVEPAREQDINWMRPVGWLSLGAAACLALLLTWQSINSISTPNKATVTNSGTSAAVAAAWARLVSGDDLLAHVDSEDEDALSRLDTQLSTETDVDDSLAPHWLLAAVEAPQVKP